MVRMCVLFDFTHKTMHTAYEHIQEKTKKTFTLWTVTVTIEFEISQMYISRYAYCNDFQILNDFNTSKDDEKSKL